MNIEKKKALVYTHYLENPCLSEPMDYETQEVREQYYSEVVGQMLESDLDEYIEEYELGKLMESF